MIIPILLFSITKTGKTPKTRLNHPDQNLKKLLEDVPFVSLEEICQDRIVQDFDLWYESWIIHFLQRNKYQPGHRVDEEIHDGVAEHLEDLQNYLNKLASKKPDLSKFPPIHLDAKISHLNKQVNLIMDDQFPNKFEEPAYQEELQKKHGYYIPALITSVLKEPLESDLINTIGISYKEDYDMMPTSKNELMKEKIDELKPPLIATLKKILKVFATNKPGVYENLARTPEKKQWLQEFYDRFRFLLTPEEIRETIMENMIGKRNKKGSYNGPFFTSELFDELSKLDTPFRPLIRRDKFITIPVEENDLEKIHEAAKRFFFSWAFFNEFDANQNDLELFRSSIDRKKDSPDQKRKRKEARLRLMLYKVYLFARKEGTIPHDEDMTNENIFRALKKWIEETKNYDQPIVGPSGIVELPNNDCAQLFPAEKFRRYHLPLLHLICSRIQGCSLVDENNIAKTVENFLKHGNYKELQQKQNVASLLPTNLIEKVEQQVLQDAFKAVDSQIEDIFDEDEEDQERTGQPEDETFPGKQSLDRFSKTPSIPGLKDNLWHEPKKSELVKDDQMLDIEGEELDSDKTPLKKTSKVMLKKQSQVLEKATPKQEKAFEQVMDEFIPANEPITPKGEKFLKEYLKKVQETGNQKKKRVLLNIIRTIVNKRYKEEQEKLKDIKKSPETLKIVQIINTDLATTLRNSYDYSQSQGIKNFFMRVINRDMNMQYKTVSVLEQKIYNYDIIFFLWYANKDRLIRAQRQREELSEEQFSLIEIKTQDTDRVLEEYFFSQKDEHMPTVKRTQMREKLIFQNPLLFEHISAFEFFINFFDFFDYYKNIPRVSHATYGNYHNIYLNFYSFLNTLRTQMTSKIDNPHSFVLEKLEACLDYTEHVERYTKSVYKTICRMSHRKFAEIYYFYKLYLISENKLSKVSLMPYSGSSFDTHVRIFVNFVANHPTYSHFLEEGCSTQVSAPICFVWTFYNKCLTYIHTPNLSSRDLVNLVGEMYQPSNINSKIHILNALEALHMNVLNGNIKDYEKILGLLSVLRDNNLHVLKFGADDVPSLTNYLSRTYRKMVYSIDEAPTAQAVQQILNGPSSPDLSKDSFGMYMIHGGIVYLDYVKLFLVMASTPNEYERIAKFFVTTESGNSLIKINNLSYDKEFADFFSDVRLDDIPVERRAERIMRFMKKRYEANYQIAQKTIFAEINSHVEDDDDYDPMAEYANEQVEEMEKVVHKETQNYSQVLEKMSSQQSLKSSSIQSEKRSDNAEVIVVHQEFQFEISDIDDNIDYTEDENVVQITTEVVEGVDMEGNLGVPTQTKAYMRVNGQQIDYNEVSSMKEALNANLKKFLENGKVTSQTEKTYKVGTGSPMQEIDTSLHSITLEDFTKLVAQKLSDKKTGNKNEKMII